MLFWLLFLNITTRSTVGFARRSGRAERRKGDCPFSCIFFIPPNLPHCWTVLCKTPKLCFTRILSSSQFAVLLRASSAHTGAETAQICSNTPSVVSLLYPPCKLAEIAQICSLPISVYRHPARELPSPDFLPSPASISTVKGLAEFWVPVVSTTSTRSKAPFLLSPDSS